MATSPRTIGANLWTLLNLAGVDGPLLGLNYLLHGYARLLTTGSGRSIRVYPDTLRSSIQVENVKRRVMIYKAPREFLDSITGGGQAMSEKV